LSPIGDLDELETLSIEGALKLNLAPLRKLVKLSRLSLSGQGAHRVVPIQFEDLDAIGELHALKTLSFMQAQITDLSFMRGLPDLTELTIVNSNVSDITGIGQAKALTTIHFEDARVPELAPLVGLPNLREVFVQRTPVGTDVLAALQQRGVKVQ
jgi:internalin A